MCGLYVHVVYCSKKCLYCDFFSAGARIADWHRYVDALISELQHRINELTCHLRTIYIGGGTPSLMPAGEFDRFVMALKPFASEVEEFTIEVNPDDLTAEMLEVWKRGGVNRLSIGIQSFNDKVLSAIGRRHDGKTAEAAYRLARNYFGNISVDLMFGLPGQTMEMWIEDVEKAVSLHPQHISAYSLMYEPGTAITSLRDSGRIDEIPEDMSRKMFALLTERLRSSGYEHYEISNYAVPGYRSRHNSSYWHQTPYLGIGPSAHSYDGDRHRKANSADIRGYLHHWAPLNTDSYGRPYEVEEEWLTKDELREEYVMTRLRTRKGIPLDDFASRFGENERVSLINKSKKMLDDNLLELHDGHLAFVESAIMMSDSIILSLA